MGKTDEQSVHVNLRMGQATSAEIDDVVKRLRLNPRTWRQQLIRDAIEEGWPAVRKRIEKVYGAKAA